MERGDIQFIETDADPRDNWEEDREEARIIGAGTIEEVETYLERIQAEDARRRLVLSDRVVEGAVYGDRPHIAAPALGTAIQSYDELNPGAPEVYGAQGGAPDARGASAAPARVEFGTDGALPRPVTHVFVSYPVTRPRRVAATASTVRELEAVARRVLREVYDEENASAKTPAVIVGGVRSRTHGTWGVWGFPVENVPLRGAVIDGTCAYLY